MWKKDEAQPGQPTTESVQTKTPRSAPAAAPSRKATIGPSITIRGDVTGSEDLLIQGSVDGSVTLDLHSIAVGGEGRVKADITGRVITIEGEVEGDLTAKEQVVLLGSARVQGDIKAPRVVLEDGATFRGLVDMGAPPTNGRTVAVEPAEEAKKASPASKTGNGATDRPKSPSSTGTTSKAATDRPGRSSSGGKGAAGEGTRPGA